MLQKKLAAALRKSGRPVPGSRAIEENDSHCLMKRTSSPAEECNARYAQPYKAKQTFGLHTNRDQTNRYFRDDFVTGMMKNDNEEQDCKEGITKRTTNMSSNCDQNFTAYDIRTTGPRTVDSDSGNENNKASKTKSANDVLKADANGIITPLMANGLKKTFVRCHNNMLTIVEEKQESHYPSPFMDKGRNPLQSPKRHVNIEQLRLGFSADSKSLFSLKNNSRPPVELFKRAEPAPSQKSTLADPKVNTSFAMSSRILDDEPEFFL